MPAHHDRALSTFRWAGACLSHPSHPTLIACAEQAASTCLAPLSPDLCLVYTCGVAITAPRPPESLMGGTGGKFLDSIPFGPLMHFGPQDLNIAGTGPVPSARCRRFLKKFAGCRRAAERHRACACYIDLGHVGDLKSGRCADGPGPGPLRCPEQPIRACRDRASRPRRRRRLGPSGTGQGMSQGGSSGTRPSRPCGR